MRLPLGSGSMHLDRRARLVYLLVQSNPPRPGRRINMPVTDCRSSRWLSAGTRGPRGPRLLVRMFLRAIMKPARSRRHMLLAVHGAYGKVLSRVDGTTTGGAAGQRSRTTGYSEVNCGAGGRRPQTPEHFSRSPEYVVSPCPWWSLIHVHVLAPSQGQGQRGGGQLYRDWGYWGTGGLLEGAFCLLCVYVFDFACGS
jgi:hypothetical protein